MKTVLTRTILVLALLSLGTLVAIAWLRRAPSPPRVRVPEFAGSERYPREYRPLESLSYPEAGLWDAADLPRDAFPAGYGPVIAEAVGAPAAPDGAAGSAVAASGGTAATTPRWRLIAVGDVMAHADLQVAAARHRHDPGETSGGYDHLFAGVAPLFADADLVLGNLETPVAPGRPRSGYPRFNADPFLLDALARLGFDVLSTANNHAFDQGLAGVVETHAELERRGLAHLGTQHPDRAPRDHLLVTLGEAPALRLGLVAVTLAVSRKPEHPDLLEWPPPGRDPAEHIARRIRAARSAGAEAVLVFLHWGREYHVTPTPAQRELARALCLAGADVVLGAGPHVIQPLEVLHSRDGRWLDGPAPGARRHLVAYSLGNFVSHQRGLAQYGLALELVFEPGADGPTVTRAIPHVLRTVVEREAWREGGVVDDHDGFRLVPETLERFVGALR